MNVKPVVVYHEQWGTTKLFYDMEKAKIYILDECRHSNIYDEELKLACYRAECINDCLDIIEKYHIETIKVMIVDDIDGDVAL